jgi:D-3-phosphoglycerate dehydrogenase
MYHIWFERQLPSQYSSLLNGVAVAVGPASATPSDPLSALPGSHAIIASARIRYNGEVMDRAPTLRVISRTGIGVDNISIPEATARGIAICNAPDAPSLSTAEHTITLILSTVKHLRQCEASLRRGGQVDYFTQYQGVDLQGLCLGIIGLGRIGRRVAKFALALDMKVIGFDPYLPPEQITDLGVELAPTLEAALSQADVISLHLPLMPDTKHLINAERLACMKPGAYLVNAARGGLVDEAALLHALDSGHLNGAGLDVFEKEPPSPDHPLLNRDNVIATPHIAGATLASKDRLWRAAIAQALQVLNGERPPHLVNPEVWPD